MQQEYHIFFSKMKNEILDKTIYSNFNLHFTSSNNICDMGDEIKY